MALIIPTVCRCWLNENCTSHTSPPLPCPICCSARRLSTATRRGRTCATAAPSAGGVLPRTTGSAAPAPAGKLQACALPTAAPAPAASAQPVLMAGAWRAAPASSAQPSPTATTTRPTRATVPPASLASEGLPVPRWVQQMLGHVPCSAAANSACLGEADCSLHGTGAFWAGLASASWWTALPACCGSNWY